MDKRLCFYALVLFACVAPLYAQDAPPVRAITVESKSVIEEVAVTGSVISKRRAALSPAVAGLVDALAVEVGDKVVKGQVLIELDDELEKLALARLESTRSERSASLTEAQRLAEEAERLGPENGISRSEIEARKAAVRIAQAGVDALDAQINEQTARIRRFQVRAPFDGIIAARSTDLGQWATPGTSLLELVSVRPLWFEFQVPQSLFPRIATDTRIDVVVPALTDRQPDAQIAALVPAGRPESRTFTIRAVESSAEALPVLPGMSCSATLYLDTGSQAPVVPRDALIRYPDGRVSVWVVDTQRSTVTEQQVQLGLTLGAEAEILSGIAAGDTIVVEGNEALRDGQQVKLLDS